MDYPTYSLRPAGIGAGAYRQAVAELACEVVALGETLRPTVEAYAYFIDETGCEERRSYEEYLLEALMIGVLWRARGHEAMAAAQAPAGLLQALVGERRAGCGRRRDGSNAALVLLDLPFVPGSSAPSMADFVRLLEWLLASGEYEDEVARLEPWREHLDKQPAAGAILRSLVRFADQFEGAGERLLGRFTRRVDDFLRVLPQRGRREDTVQCSRRRVEYHFNMVGAEILNRAWRDDFLACDRHVVLLPGCARRRDDRACAARRAASELRCTGCSTTCTVSAATAVAARAGAEALAVLHGSDFARFLRSPALAGGNIGIVGVACVPGLVGAGWRARAQGLPAQCVLLQASGCSHWQAATQPTTFDTGELGRILARDSAPGRPAHEPCPAGAAPTRVSHSPAAAGLPAPANAA